MSIAFVIPMCLGMAVKLPPRVVLSPVPTVHVYDHCPVRCVERARTASPYVVRWCAAHKLMRFRHFVAHRSSACGSASRLG